MKETTTPAFLFVLSLTVGSAAFGAADNQNKAASYPKVTHDNFRCERMNDGTLSSLKDKLLENCDLNRPYTVAATDNLSNHSYIYCCHLQ